ncbi:hypothetical protein CSKR_112712 [Clonorchis sinensis]|uniref:Uncharacterized protein n=1 Tax=Clonorchis sinensis TaxID=79923 RepID=A0A419PX44_CLOSI|nr:hypothetical protein CSKR_112712 [Clonorchis sinensis]
MNPHRRVGVMPTSTKIEGDMEAKQPPPPSPPETEADPVPPEAHFLHIPGGITAYTLSKWQVKFDLPYINGVLAVGYTVIGALLCFFTLTLLPYNDFSKGTLYCKEGYCAYRARSASQLLLNHNTATAFHPYNWTVLVTGVFLLVYGLVVWSKITSHVINVGYALNVATLIYTFYATVLSYYHWDDPPYRAFSPFSFTGVLHSSCGPILLHMTTICLLVQAIINVPGVYVHGIHYYPEIALDPTASERTKVG